LFNIVILTRSPTLSTTKKSILWMFLLVIMTHMYYMHIHLLKTLENKVTKECSWVPTHSEYLNRCKFTAFVIILSMSINASQSKSWSIVLIHTVVHLSNLVHS